MANTNRWDRDDHRFRDRVGCAIDPQSPLSGFLIDLRFNAVLVKLNLADQRSEQLRLGMSAATAQSGNHQVGLGVRLLELLGIDGVAAGKAHHELLIQELLGNA